MVKNTRIEAQIKKEKRNLTGMLALKIYYDNVSSKQEWSYYIHEYGNTYTRKGERTLC